MPQILVLFEFPSLNGGELSLLQVVDELSRTSSEWQFTALAPGSGRLADALAERSIEHLVWAVRGPDGIKRPTAELANELAAHVRHRKPDLVHANSLSMSRLLGSAKRDLETPTSGHLRDILKLSQAAIADLNQLDLLLGVSQATVDFHCRQGLRSDRCEVVFNGVVAEQNQSSGRMLSSQSSSSQPETAWAEIESAAGLDQPVRWILNAGQLGLRKDPGTLLAALPEVLREHPQAHVVMAGERNSEKAESVEYERQLHHTAAQPPLTGHVHWPGYVENLARHMPRFDLLVHTARQEPLGRVLLEAAAAGLPVIATDVGGTREILQHEVSGLLVPAGDPDSLAAAIRRLLSEPETARRLAASAQQVARERFSIQTCAERHVRSWQALIDQDVTSAS